MVTADQAASPGITWRWQPALFVLVCAIPAGIATLDDLSRGLALGFGVIPAAAIGLPPSRRRRVMIVVAGLSIAVGLMVGSVLGQVPVVAVAGLFLIAFAVSLSAGRSGTGALALVLVVPMVASGLSFDGLSDSIQMAGLLLIGSLVTWIVSLAWPDTSAMHAADPGSRRIVGVDLVEYGVRLGLAGALCAAVGFLGDFDHEGWVAAACLLVMRPSPVMVRLRAAGRAAFVTGGATAAAVLTRIDPPNVVWSVAIVVDLMLLAGTRTSRWYVTGGFTTFIVISLVIHGDAEHGADVLNERVLETLIGVTVALVFGSIHLWRPAPLAAAASAPTRT